MIAGVVLAAGRSRRMGSPKALLELRGRSFLDHAVRGLLDGGCGEVVVVVGPEDQPGIWPVAKSARSLGARVVANATESVEQIDSLRTALRALSAEVEAVVVTPVDVPGVAPEVVRVIVANHRRRGAPIVLPTYRGRRGHPALFARSLVSDLLADGLEEGARSVIRAHEAEVLEVAVDDAGILHDVDTPADYRRLADEEVTAAEALERVLAALEGGEPVAEVVVIASTNPSVRAGARMVVGEARADGGLGDASLDARAAELAREALRTGRTESHAVEQAAGGCELYVEPHAPAAELVIVGAGHIARPLCRIGAMLGFRVTVLDDRPEFATRERFPEAERLIRADFSDPLRGLDVGAGTHLVLATRGHKYDYEVLRQLLRRPRLPAYIGMIGSRRRVRATLEALKAEGVERGRLGFIHAPVGLDVGAETPAEIAVSIAAELVRERRGGTGTPLRERARVVDRWLREVD